MPVWEAMYVIIVATRTGWTEEFIRHHLPLSRGMAYYHACRLLDGERCRWPGRKSSTSKFIDGIRKWVRRSLNSTRTP